MGDSFIRALLSTLKSKITPLVTKIRFFFTPQFWRTKIISKFREIFSKVFDVRPKHKDDYYGFWRYLVSKRLAYAIVLVIGVLSVVYIVSIRGMLFPQETGIKSYHYNSIMLRFANSNKVIITGKGGYKAYEGAVSKGTVTGNGQLFDKDENLIYRGAFVNNKYNGQGTAYYPSGVTKYNGSFVENYYEGMGKLFRESGSLEYDGEFVGGLKDGTGTLFDKGGNQVYTGTFSQDELLYFELLGKTASEVRENYTGDWRIYESSNDYCMYMPDIEALYSGTPAEDSVEDETKVETVYIMKNTLTNGPEKLSKIEELKGFFGEPLYQGNSMAVLPEAVVINIMSGNKNVLNGMVEMDYVRQYEEYYRVNSYDRRYPLYLYTFEKDGILYTFFCKEKNAGFDFYSVMKAENGGNQ